MKIAIAGKGGSGKTSISGTMARLLARDGKRVLAIDGDSNPNLALTLGLPLERLEGALTLTGDLLHRTDEGLSLATSIEELSATHALEAPDGVRLMVMANPKHAGTGCFCGSHAAVRSVIAAAGDAAEDVCILDTEASPEHLSRGTAQFADAMLTVVEPWYKSLETGRRMAVLGTDLGIPRVALVANKIRDERDLSAVREFARSNGLEIAGVIPFDEEMPGAERAGLAPLDHAPDTAAVAAIGELAARMVGDGRA